MGSRWSTRVALTTIVALALVVATAATASAKLTAAGPVVATATYQSIKGPWLVWDESTCGFKATNTHPATYRAVLRKDDPPLSVVYTPEATTFPVDPIINGSFKSAAAKSGIKLSQLSNDYPSTSRPINVANQAVQIKADVVVSANVLSNLYPQIQEIYKKGCVPMINMFNLPGTTDPAPGFQSGYIAQGIGMGSAAVAIAKKKQVAGREHLARSVWKRRHRQGHGHPQRREQGVSDDGRECLQDPEEPCHRAQLHLRAGCTHEDDRLGHGPSASEERHLGDVGRFARSRNGAGARIEGFHAEELDRRGR